MGMPLMCCVDSNTRRSPLKSCSRCVCWQGASLGAMGSCTHLLKSATVSLGWTSSRVALVMAHLPALCAVATGRPDARSANLGQLSAAASGQCMLQGEQANSVRPYEAADSPGNCWQPCSAGVCAEMGRTPLKAPAKGVTKVSCLMRPASEPVMFCQGDSCTLPSPRLRCHSVQKEALRARTTSPHRQRTCS